MSTTTTNGGQPVFVLYKVINSDADKHDDCYNCFPLHGGRPTLAVVKQNCAALYGLNHLGPEGYHWRVCVEDKQVPGESGGHKTFSWWDIQDENASLPVKEATQNQLCKLFGPKSDHYSSDSVIGGSSSMAKGAFKSMGKALSHAVGGDDSDTSGPRVKIVALKLLDMVKMHDDFATKNQGRGGGHMPPMTTAGAAAPRAPTAAPRHTPTTTTRPPPPQQQQQRTPAPTPNHAPQRTAAAPTPNRPQQQQKPAPSRPPTRQTQQPAAQANLMDFGSSGMSPTVSSGKSLHHATSMPNETSAEKLRREYAAKQQTARRVWDDVDQRWVEEVPGKSTGAAAASPTKKTVGISLDPANAVGKSANVQAAVNSRVNEMRQSQAKALQEVRVREESKKRQDEEEDAARKRLEPQIKAWSEEHGKKKQLRALLASLHTILWPDASWKQLTIGDLLDDKKVKLAFHKASRVVHPDKTHHLNAEQRFLAKRIFDALSQAKTEFDGNSN